MARRFWSVVRAACSVLRKRVSKARLLADFKIYMMMKRGKVGGKSDVFNLVFHRHESQLFRESRCVHPAEQAIDDGELLKAAMEIASSAAASPAPPPRRWSTPEVRQLRITDSPLPLPDVEEDSHVDEAAEEFIMKFYNELRLQNSNM
ncbi:uncharacterized protein LOC127262907 [Andrographis paniculata]|uniref:uncharacterized protein LOC127262907 n=1 Tax=Andrographis paniculata TaxID=175694 RepID=UPI0021E983FC|nr:uncharacterized protein LOC127262907 [Andrographis paniculata]